MRRALHLMLPLALAASAAVAQAPAAEAVRTAPYRLVDASFRSAALGGERERLRVYVPSECTRRAPCPVLYLLHGFGGSWTDWSERGRLAEHVRGADPLRMVVVMPDGGPAGFWTDWFNAGEYGPPRYETMFVRELMPFVERTFPVRRGRAWTGIDGVSLGGFGAWKLALKHPGRFASVGSMSGALNVLVAPNAPLRVAAPAAVPWTGDALPGPPPGPAPDIPGFPFGNPVRVFGDPVTNEWYYRTNNPLDLAPNAKGLAMRQLVFDAEPAAEAPSPGTFGDVGLEAAVLPMNLEMDARLTELGYPHEFELARGNHSWASRDPYVREQLEFHARALNGRARPPRAFTYRTAERRFEAHGWRFDLEREVNEFLEVEFSPGRFVLRGGGDVAIESPPIFRPCLLYRWEFEGPHLLGGISGDGEGWSNDRRILMDAPLGNAPPIDHHEATGVLPGSHVTTTMHYRQTRLRVRDCPRGGGD